MADYIINAPFTPDQVVALNKWQHSGLQHPFTCAGKLKPKGLHSDEEGILVATEAGWVCECGYTQYWAWNYMAEHK